MTYYVPDFKGNIAPEIERQGVYKIYRRCRFRRSVDKDLVPYIDELFKNKSFLIPIFSCSGHREASLGHFLFRSSASVEDTVESFKRIKTICKQNYSAWVDVKLQIWNDEALGYMFVFRNKNLDDVMHVLLSICNEYDSLRNTAKVFHTDSR